MSLVNYKHFFFLNIEIFIYIIINQKKKKKKITYNGYSNKIQYVKNKMTII